MIKNHTPQSATFCFLWIVLFVTINIIPIVMSAASASADRIALHEEFDNFQEFEKCLVLYEQKYRQAFQIVDCHRLEKNKPKGAPPNYDCIYLNCRLACIYGEQRHQPRGLGLRETKTIKNGCPSFMYIKLTVDNQRLKITQLNLSHQGHEGSEEFFHILPKNRQLRTKEEIAEVKKLLSAGCKISGVQNLLMNEGKSVLPKDLQNFRQRHMKQPSDDDIDNALHLLKNVYKAQVDVIYENCDGQKNVVAIYFSTKEMRAALKAWPEVVFVDSTYKLLKRGYITLLMCVQDSLGLTHIAAIALIANEQMDTLKEVFLIFQKKNSEASERIQCFMTDKDLTERSILKVVFPNAALCICEFHTLKIFSRTITINGMRITSSQRDEALNILDKLVKCDSLEQYEYWYEKFCKEVPPTVVNYFENNWEPNRLEWVRYAVTEHSFGNYTNNPVESTNARLKDGISSNSTFKDYITNLFSYLSRRKITIQNYIHNDIYKHPVHQDVLNATEINYQKILTSNAFALLKQQLKRKEPMDFLNINETHKNCWITSGHRVITASTTECECSSYLEKKLPCRHIFAVRAHFKLDLYDINLCPKKYTKQFNADNQPVLQRSGLVGSRHSFSNSSATEKSTSSPSPITYSHIKTPKPKNKQQRYNMIKQLTNELADVGCTAVGAEFEKRVKLLKNVRDSWRNNKEICIDDTLSESIAELSVTKPHVESEISQGGKSGLVCATPLKLRGRPSNVFKSTISAKKK